MQSNDKREEKNRFVSGSIETNETKTTNKNLKEKKKPVTSNYIVTQTHINQSNVTCLLALYFVHMQGIYSFTQIHWIGLCSGLFVWLSIVSSEYEKGQLHILKYLNCSNG